MDQLAAVEPTLKPPQSVMLIAKFLTELAGRRTLHPEPVGDAWKRHGLTPLDAKSAADWMRGDRASANLPERKLKAPEKFLAKHQEPEEETGKQIVERQEPGTELHLWQALFQGTPAQGAKGGRTSASPNGTRFQPFGDGYNRGFLDAALALSSTEPEATPSRTRPRSFASFLVDREDPAAGGAGPEKAAPGDRPLTNGMASAEFGRQIVDGNVMSPTWNEPLRRDLVPLFGYKYQPLQPPSDQPIPPMANPLYGQITLVTPPLTVSPDQGQGASVAMKFDWRDMAKGIGPVDESSFATLASSLPPGSKALYPAMDPRSLRGGAVNLRLAPTMIQNLVAMGYGAPQRVDSFASARMASDYYGGTPPSLRLPGQLAPLDRPGRRRLGIGGALPQGGAGSPAEEPGRRMRFLDYLGLPIYLSPTFNVDPGLDQEMQSRIGMEFMPRAPLMSNLSFFNLRNRLLGSFQSVEAKPETGAWQARGPTYDRSGMSMNRILQTALGGFGGGRERTSPLTPMRPGPASALAGAQTLGSLPSMGSRPQAPRGSFSASLRLPTVGAPPPIGGPAPAVTAGHPVGAALRSAAATAPMASSPSLGRMLPHAAPASRPPAAIGAKPMPGAGPVTLRPVLTPQTHAGRGKGAFAPTPRSPGKARPAATPAPVPAAAMPRSIPATPLASPPKLHHAPGPDHKHADPALHHSPHEAPAHAATPPSVRRPAQVLATPHRQPHDHAEALAVQTSLGDGPAAAQAPSGNGGTTPGAAKKDSGMPGSEINLLANEVWSLLKRRLAFEAQRSGR